MGNFQAQAITTDERGRGTPVTVTLWTCDVCGKVKANRDEMVEVWWRDATGVRQVDLYCGMVHAAEALDRKTKAP
jgi:hypothetical protein